MKLQTIFAAVVLSGCALGPPPGFSQGSTWTLPLVDPLADGRLVTVLTVEGKGPYLVAIDPDAPYTVLDGNIIAEGHFPAKASSRQIDETDTSHPSFSAVVTNLRIGDLAISQRTVLVAKHLAFAGDGRPILGVLGRDIIADSLVFGFDRDRGIAWLQTEDTYKAPSDAIEMPYFKGTRARGDLVTRRLVSAEIDGKKYDLHLDLGAAESQLRPEHWPQAELQTMPKTTQLVDEFGGRRTTDVVGVAAKVSAGKLTREHIGFVPYQDQRWDFGQLEGSLGLDFFEPYSVTADWHHERYLLAERKGGPEARADRFARWGDAIPAPCRANGCANVTLQMVDGKIVATAVRDPAAAGKPLELVARAVNEAGAPLRRLVVNFPANVDRIEVEADAHYENAKLEIVDASPFPFECANGCILVEAIR